LFPRPSRTRNALWIPSRTLLHDVTHSVSSRPDTEVIRVALTRTSRPTVLTAVAVLTAVGLINDNTISSGTFGRRISTRVFRVFEKLAPHSIMANSKTVCSNDVFEDLDVDRLEVNVIESLCFSCGKNVSIRPYFRPIFWFTNVETRNHNCANKYSRRLRRIFLI